MNGSPGGLRPSSAGWARTGRLLFAATLLGAIVLGTVFVNLGASATTTSYRQEVLADQPAAYWRLGETLGSTATDEVGLNRGSYNGGVTLGQPGATSDGDRAAAFDGSNDYVVVPASTTLDATQSVSIELWVKRAKSGEQVLVGKPGNRQSKFENYALWINSGNRTQAYFGNGSSFVSVTGPTLDTAWHHVVATYDGTVARIFQDGALSASTTATLGIKANTQPLNLARANNNKDDFGGVLDEVAIYRTALPAARVQAHYNRALADLTAPTISLSRPVNGSTVKDSTPTMSGTAGTATGDSATVTVRIYAGGVAAGAPIQNLSASRDGAGGFSVDAGTLADGLYTAQGEQSDAAGNVGQSPPTSFTINTDFDAPVISLAQPADGSTTNDATPTFSGTAGTAAGDATKVTVKLYSGTSATGTPVGTFDTTRDSSGAFSVDASTIADGTYTAQAEQSDSGGNTGRSSANTFTYRDGTPPLISLDQPADGSSTTDATPTLSGNAGTAPGDSSSVTIKLYSGATATGTPLQTLTATRGPSGSFSTDAQPLTDGTYSAQAQQSDSAGNVGLSQTNTFTYHDTAAPLVSLAQPANGSTTRDTTPSFSGLAGTALGDSSTVAIKIYAGTGTSGSLVQTLSTTRNSTGAFSADASTLPFATYTAQAEQGDGAGNVGRSAANTFTVSEAPDPVLIGAGDIASCESGDGDASTAALIAANPDATVFTLGDNAYPNGQPAEYTSCYNASWGAFKGRTHPAVGGHDLKVLSGGPAAGQGYVDYFRDQLSPMGATATDLTKLYYSYDVGTWHVAVLNAGCYYETPGCDTTAMENWFRQDLASHPNSCTVAMWHDARFSSGNIHGNSTFVQPLWAIAYDAGVDVVLSGHEHAYERFAPQDANGGLDPTFGVRQFVVGTGGYYLYGLGTRQPNSEVFSSSGYGVLKLGLHSNSYDWEFVPAAGSSYRDSGTGNCHGSPVQSVDGPQVRSTATATAPQGVSTMGINKPSGTQAGDLLLAVVSHQGGSTRTMTAPAGWTAVPNADAYEGGNARIRAWYHVAGSSEPASYDFTTSGGTAWATAGGIMSVTGANLMSPIAASGGQSTGATNTLNLTAPSITPLVANTLLVYGGAVNQPDTFTPPQLMTEQWDLQTATTYNIATETAVRGSAQSGSTGPATAFLSVAARGAAIQIAIAPAI